MHQYETQISLLRRIIVGVEKASGMELGEARAALEALDKMAEGSLPPVHSKVVTMGASTEQLEREFLNQVAPVATLNDWAALVNAWAEAKQWNRDPVHIGDTLMLIVTELAEAKEDDRNDKMVTYRDEKGKPCGLPSEIADALIRIFHFAGRMGWDLNREVAIKMGYNYSRAPRHGGLKS